MPRENGIYRGSDLHPIGRIQEDFEKFFAALVPRRHEREVNIHSPVAAAGIFFEESCALRFVAQNFVQRIGGPFSGDNRQKNAAAKYRIDKPSSITGQ